MKKNLNIVIPTCEDDSLSKEVLIKLLEDESVTVNEDSEAGMHTANALRKLKVYNWPIYDSYIDYCICQYFIKLNEVPAKILRMSKLMLLGRM